jgi:hypothetical protein
VGPGVVQSAARASARSNRSDATAPWPASRSRRASSPRPTRDCFTRLWDWDRDGDVAPVGVGGSTTRVGQEGRRRELGFVEPAPFQPTVKCRPSPGSLENSAGTVRGVALVPHPPGTRGAVDRAILVVICVVVLGAVVVALEGGSSTSSPDVTTTTVDHSPLRPASPTCSPTGAPHRSRLQPSPRIRCTAGPTPSTDLMLFVLICFGAVSVGPSTHGRDADPRLAVPKTTASIWAALEHASRQIGMCAQPDAFGPWARQGPPGDARGRAGGRVP